MNLVYLLTGTNLGDRAAHLIRARQQLAEKCGTITATSALYETAAWGKEDQPSFLNQAIELQTEMSPEDLLKTILSIEQSMGRIREEKYGPRIIDIDILFFGDRVIRGEGLTIPHPEIQNRRFALCCMNDLAPFLFHPVLGKVIAELLEDCPDHLPVKRITPNLKKFNA